ncbi:MAG: LuxR C-terminal-related transcriptional regulator [Treponema sp.]|jgi:DNA-binding NarL/FixJ family response regulator|nr:LuxR C-terminal-related transcriptional regulator [Treponema sp.]
MAGGTLVISRQVTNFDYFKMKLHQLGYTNVHCTDLDKDGLFFHIADMKPDIVIMSAQFYYCSTPYMLGLLKTAFPKLYFSVISVGEYPLDLAMSFIVNGAKAYASTADGKESFYYGVEMIRQRKIFIPRSVQERFDMRKEYPAPAKKLSPIRAEVLRCVCNGFSNEDIADNLAICKATVENHKKEIYRSLNARNAFDLFIAAHRLGIVSMDELVFHHSNFECSPFPEKD